MKYLTIILVFLTTPLLAQVAADNWQPLFNGKDLSEWTQRGSNADYQLEDGVIIGTSVQTPKNSFLCTNKTYSDFILEFDVKLDHGINSGIQIRSESKPDYNNGQVHGYQVELDPSPVRRWTAGIYDEGRRGWLYPLTRNPEGQNAFIIGDWNKIRIEAIGHHIRTWVNGIQCTNLVDNMTSEGFIGLQVHGIGGDDTPGKQIRWKNMRIKTTDLEKERLPVASHATEINYIPNRLTENEKRKGWRLLWDGKNLTHWDNPLQNNWNIEEGSLILEDNYNSLFYNQLVENFELSFEFQLSENTNGFLKYHGGTIQQTKPLLFVISNDKNIDEPIAQTGALKNLIAPENLSDLSSSRKRYNGVGTWNKARIIVNNGKVEHWLNNMKVVEYDWNAQVFKSLASCRNANDVSDLTLDKDIIVLNNQNFLAFGSYGKLKLRSIKIREF